MKHGFAVRTSHSGGHLPRPLLRLVADGAPGSAPTSRLAALCDRIIAASSLLPTTALLDIRACGWSGLLRDHWRDVAAEAEQIAGDTPVSPASHPITAALLAQIPQLYRAQFQRLDSGVAAIAQPRAGRALITCHLGLDIPREGDLRMRLGSRTVRWAEGETLVFDQSQAEVQWNDAARPGLVLALQIRRPLRQPGRWIADRLLDAER